MADTLCGVSVPPIVVKIGGSVLTGPPAYRRVARVLAARLCEHPAEKILVIVSAEEGATDALLAVARDLVNDPSPDALDLLWSTGELRSVALLVLALHAQGVRAASANVHQTGLELAADGAPRGGPFRSSRAPRVRILRLRSLLATADIVVAPGFLARAEGDRVRSLGRGGSDLTAVLLAAGLGARACELVKDVPGYFTGDPARTPDATPIPALAFDTAIEMAQRGCELVQLRALEAARELHVPLIVRGLNGGTETLVN